MEGFSINDWSSIFLRNLLLHWGYDCRRLVNWLFCVMFSVDLLVILSQRDLSVEFLLLLGFFCIMSYIKASASWGLSFRMFWMLSFLDLDSWLLCRFSLVLDNLVIVIDVYFWLDLPGLRVDLWLFDGGRHWMVFLLLMTDGCPFKALTNCWSLHREQTKTDNQGVFLHFLI